MDEKKEVDVDRDGKGEPSNSDSKPELNQPNQRIVQLYRTQHGISVAGAAGPLRLLSPHPRHSVLRRYIRVHDHAVQHLYGHRLHDQVQ